MDYILTMCVTGLHTASRWLDTDGICQNRDRFKSKLDYVFEIFWFWQIPLISRQTSDQLLSWQFTGEICRYRYFAKTTFVENIFRIPFFPNFGHGKFGRAPETSPRLTPCSRQGIVKFVDTGNWHNLDLSWTFRSRQILVLSNVAFVWSFLGMRVLIPEFFRNWNFQKTGKIDF